MRSLKFPHAGGTHFSPPNLLDDMLMFEEGSDNDDTICIEIETIEDFAFNTYRVFSVTVELKEESTGITLLISRASVHIANDDSK